MEHWFWTLLCALVLIWYFVVTIVVAIKGSVDIKKMLENWQQDSDVQ